MAKILAFFLLSFSMLHSNVGHAAIKKKKSKKHGSYKVSKHSRKSRRFHRGTGPDLKAITTDSDYKEYPNNGVNPLETK